MFYRFTFIFLLASHILFAQDLLPVKGIFKIDSAIPNSRENKDLRVFDSTLKGKRIVFLGEANHADGTTLELKGRLINYLINNLGFEVLILEKNIYQTHVMFELLQNSSYSKDHIIMEGFKLGTNLSSKRASLYAALKENTANNKDFKVEGIDVAYSNIFRKRLKNDLIEVGIDPKTASEYDRLLVELCLLDQCPDCPKQSFESKKFKEISLKIITCLKDARTKDKCAFLQQVLKSNLGLSEWVTTRGSLQETASDEAALEFFSFRDAIMAENLIWMLNFYSNQRIIVSTATYHMTRGIGKVKTMTDYLPDSLQRIIYYLPFGSYEGYSGLKSNSDNFLRKIERDSSSLEFELHQKGFKYCYLHFASIDTLEKERINKMTFHASDLLAAKANWAEVYDGIIFINTMQPDTLKPIIGKDLDYLLTNFYDKPIKLK